MGTLFGIQAGEPQTILRPSFAAAQETPAQATADFVEGNYWALMIGINEYPLLPPSRQLLAARPGAELLAFVLRYQYGFARPPITALLDGKASRGGILRQLRMLKAVQPNDSVLIYFAGRCQVEPASKDVWWLPADALEDDVKSFISLNDIKSLLAQIPARHIYLVADSCVSDALVGTNRIIGAKTAQEAYRKKSRWLLASGAIFPVPAGDPRQMAPSGFTNALVIALLANPEAYVTSEHLAEVLMKQMPTQARLAIRNQPIAGVRDDGGQFIFRRDWWAVERYGPEASRQETGIRPELLRGRRGQLEMKWPQEKTGQPQAEVRVEILKREIERLQVRELQERATTGLAELLARLAALPRQVEKTPQGVPTVVAPISAPTLRSPAPVGPRPEDLTPMVLIPAGEFVMGSTPRDGLADETPQLKVFVDAFYIDTFETTLGRYAKYLQATGADPPEYWNLANPATDAELPVVGVDWDQAQAYCNWAGKRLPTEAEWEKAARGTDGRKHPWGNHGATPHFANYGKGGSFDYRRRLERVGTFDSGKSPYGVYDMIGNVWEWVADWYDKNYYQRAPEKNPGGPEKGELKVIRGGSWSKIPLVVRAAGRNRADPSSQTTYIGFRCAKNWPLSVPGN